MSGTHNYDVSDVSELKQYSMPARLADICLVSARAVTLSQLLCAAFLLAQVRRLHSFLPSLLCCVTPFFLPPVTSIGANCPGLSGAIPDSGAGLCVLEHQK